MILGVTSGVWSLVEFTYEDPVWLGLPIFLRFYWFSVYLIGPIVGLLGVAILVAKDLTREWRTIIGSIVFAVSVQPIWLLASLALFVLFDCRLLAC